MTGRARRFPAARREFSGGEGEDGSPESEAVSRESDPDAGGSSDGDAYARGGVGRSAYVESDVGGNTDAGGSSGGGSGGSAYGNRRGRRGGSRSWNSNAGGDASERRREVPAESQDPEARARGLLLDSLSRSARTRGQLADMLERKGVSEEIAEAALDRFTELGLVDDAAYAEAFTRSRHEHKGLGSRAIAFELRRRSVPDELVQEAVSALDSEQEERTAFRLAGERQARMRGLPREVQARRLAGFLARKGYGGELVGRAVREALANAAAADEAEAEGDGFDPEGLAFTED